VAEAKKKRQKISGNTKWEVFKPWQSVAETLLGTFETLKSSNLGDALRTPPVSGGNIGQGGYEAVGVVAVIAPVAQQEEGVVAVLSAHLAIVDRIDLEGNAQNILERRSGHHITAFDASIKG